MKDFFLRRAREADLDGVIALLDAATLPVEGVAEAIGNFVVAEGVMAIIGVAGMEVSKPYALLRSVTVAPGWQGYGVGRALVGDVISRARSKNIEAVYLLTTTAENYFPSFGFERIDRAEVPAELSVSAELRGACPDSAVVIRLGLNPPGAEARF